MIRVLICLVLLPSSLFAQLELGPQLSLSATDRLREWQAGLGLAVETELNEDLRLIGSMLSTVPLPRQYKEYQGGPHALAYGDTTRRYVEGVQWHMRQQLGVGIATRIRSRNSGPHFHLGVISGIHWQVRGSNSDVLVFSTGEQYHEQINDRRSYFFISPLVGFRADAGRNRFCADLRTVLLIGNAREPIGPEGALFMLNVGYLWPLKS